MNDLVEWDQSICWRVIGPRLPVAALLVMTAVGKLPAPPRRTPLKAFLCSRSALALVIGLGVVGLALLLINSVVNVRSYEDPYAQLTQRLLVHSLSSYGGSRGAICRLTRQRLLGKRLTVFSSTRSIRRAIRPCNC